MPTETERSRLTVEELAGRARPEMVPLSNTFSWFAAMPVAEEDVKQYLDEPISALPPAVCSLLGKVGIILVPYLEKPEDKGREAVAFDKPQDSRRLASARLIENGAATLLFAIRDEEVSDYHYTFYNQLAALIAEKSPAEAQESFFRVLREELKSEVHGEVDDRSWHLKQALVRRQSNVRRETRMFRDYAMQALEDTLTLYLHGICCDIDVETGPRQMPSRYVRKRLELLHSLYPPPEGYAVFPEQLKKR